ncbi:hypothetical protein DIPPA_12741 [Diplonema papillatum]|nr:hypothetical protein DIPPA_12741 [Diplonema papillatum]
MQRTQSTQFFTASQYDINGLYPSLERGGDTGARKPSRRRDGSAARRPRTDDPRGSSDPPAADWIYPSAPRPSEEPQPPAPGGRRQGWAGGCLSPPAKKSSNEGHAAPSASPGVPFYFDRQSQAQGGGSAQFSYALPPPEESPGARGRGLPSPPPTAPRSTSRRWSHASSLPAEAFGDRDNHHYYHQQLPSLSPSPRIPVRPQSHQQHAAPAENPTAYVLAHRYQPPASPSPRIPVGSGCGDGRYAGHRQLPEAQEYVSAGQKGQVQVQAQPLVSPQDSHRSHAAPAENPTAFVLAHRYQPPVSPSPRIPVGSGCGDGRYAGHRQLPEAQEYVSADLKGQAQVQLQAQPSVSPQDSQWSHARPQSTATSPPCPNLLRRAPTQLRPPTLRSPSPRTERSCTPTQPKPWTPPPSTASPSATTGHLDPTRRDLRQPNPMQSNATSTSSMQVPPVPWLVRGGEGASCRDAPGSKQPAVNNNAWNVNQGDVCGSEDGGAAGRGNPTRDATDQLQPRCIFPVLDDSVAEGGGGAGFGRAGTPPLRAATYEDAADISRKLQDLESQLAKAEAEAVVLRNNYNVRSYPVAAKALAYPPSDVSSISLKSSMAGQPRGQPVPLDGQIHAGPGRLAATAADSSLQRALFPSSISPGLPSSAPRDFAGFGSSSSAKIGAGGSSNGGAANNRGSTADICTSDNLYSDFNDNNNDNNYPTACVDNDTYRRHRIPAHPVPAILESSVRTQSPASAPSNVDFITQKSSIPADPQEPRVPAIDCHLQDPPATRRPSLASTTPPEAAAGHRSSSSKAGSVEHPAQAHRSSALSTLEAKLEEAEAEAARLREKHVALADARRRASAAHAGRAPAPQQGGERPPLPWETQADSTPRRLPSPAAKKPDLVEDCVVAIDAYTRLRQYQRATGFALAP